MGPCTARVGPSRRLPLGGGRRVLGDTEASQDVLIEMSMGRGTTFTPLPPVPGATPQGMGVFAFRQRSRVR